MKVNSAFFTRMLLELFEIISVPKKYTIREQRRVNDHASINIILIHSIETLSTRQLTLQNQLLCQFLFKPYNYVRTGNGMAAAAEMQRSVWAHLVHWRQIQKNKTAIRM